MWFIDKIETTLPSIALDLEKNWTSQWNYNYSFSIDRNGTNKLAFLLYTSTTEDYIKYEDYKGIAEQKISSAYRETYLWIDVI